MNKDYQEQNNNIASFKILKLWYEQMSPTGIHVLLGEFSKIEEVAISSTFKGNMYSNNGLIFIMLKDSDMSFFVSNEPQDDKKLDLNEFIEGSITLKGISMCAYYHKDYLEARARFYDEYFYFSQEIDVSNLESKLEISCKKEKGTIQVSVKDGMFSESLLYFFCEAINKFINSDLFLKSNVFCQSEKGLLQLEVCYQIDPSDVKVSKVSVFGFSIEEIRSCLHNIEKVILQ